MNPLIELCLWIALLSIVTSYACWVRMRVWLLRQDLFNVRDALWHSMHSKGMLENSEYQATRDGINSMIRIAPWLSFIVLFRMLFGGVKQRSRSEALLEEVVSARRATVQRLLRYMLFETATGLAVCAVAQIYMFKSMVEKQIRQWIERIFDSEEVLQVDYSKSSSTEKCLSP